MMSLHMQLQPYSLTSALSFKEMLLLVKFKSQDQRGQDIPLLSDKVRFKKHDFTR